MSDTGEPKSNVWTETSSDYSLDRPLNLPEDVTYPGVRFRHHPVRGRTLTLHQYDDVEILWYNYGVYVLDRDGHPIKELCYLYGQAPPVESLKVAEPRLIDGVTASISHWVPGNYCHILCEHLPLLQALDDAGQIGHVDHILCDNWARGLVGDALEVFSDARCDVIGIKMVDHVRCRRLLAFEPIDHPAHWGHNVMLRFFDRIRERAGPALPFRRLIVTRPVGRRGFANQGQLTAALPNFQTVDLDRPLSLYEQARTFAEAKIIVCGHGAALTNLAFMRPGTGVIEIFNHNYGMATYWALSGARGLRYCASIDQRGPTLYDVAGKGSDMIVDVSSVLSCVDLLERGHP